MPEAPPIYSPTLHSAGLAAMEALVNRALALDPATRQRLDRLSDHVFLFHCTQPQLGIYLIPGPGEVRLCGTYASEANTTLKGSASEFARLASADDPANVLINGKLELHGNSQALIDLQTILHDLDIDWEAPLSEIFGDVLGFQLGQVVRHSFSFGRQALQSLKRQADEYLLEESQMLAPNWRLREFFDEIDQLAMRTERLQARVNKLIQSRRT